MHRLCFILDKAVHACKTGGCQQRCSSSSSLLLVLPAPVTLMFPAQMCSLLLPCAPGGVAVVAQWPFGVPEERKMRCEDLPLQSCFLVRVLTMS